MLRHSLDLEGEFNSPLAQGRIDKAYDNLEIRLLHAPQFNDFVKTAIFCEYGSSGGGKGRSILDFLDELDNAEMLERLAPQFMEGGLYQFLEADTVTFLIYGCSRSWTHEAVRTRKGAWYMQQTMRHSMMGNANLRMSEHIASRSQEEQDFWIQSVRSSVGSYMHAVEKLDWPYQDARTLLPLSTETWIVMGMPIRTFLETYAYRACSMFYPEMVYIWRTMGTMLAESCPWLANKIKVSCEIPDGQGKNWCHFRGTEPVEEFCKFPWAKAESRLFKSHLYEK
jgi:hypothetical protein